MTAAGRRAGLYVHVPFCSAVCPYCDFAVRRDDPARHARYLADVLREAGLRRDADALAFDTVYLGGGTPSALDDDALGALLEGLRARLPVAPDAVLHLEANPEDVTPARLAAWRALGVRFLSLGVQAFDDDELRFLGRRHDGRGAERALRSALEAGIPTVSADLIFGLPGRDAADWDRNLDHVARIAPGHVSCYQLTVKEGTPFFARVARGRWREIDEDLQADLLDRTRERLGAAGLFAYEVSNHAASPAHRSPHNQGYWRHEPFVGLGPGAHSFAEGRRSWNPRDLETWSVALARDDDPREGEERPTPAEEVLERLMLGLRWEEGVSLPRLRALGFDPVRERAAEVARWQARGCLETRGERLVAPPEGWALADAMARDLSPEV